MPERGVPHAEGTATPCTEPDPPMPSETCPDALSGKGPELGARRPASAPFPKKKTRGYPHRSDMRGSCVFGVPIYKSKQTSFNSPSFVIQ